MNWKRLAGVRTAILSLAGFGFLCAAAWSVSFIFGLAAIGVSCLLIEYLGRDQ